MMNRSIIPSVKRDHRGVTLIELMVAMVIGLFMIGAVLYVVQESQVSYRHNDEFGRIQEAGRIGIELMAYDARMAGFAGCLPQPPNNTVIKALPPPSFGLLMSDMQAIRGETYPAGTSASIVNEGALLGAPGSEVVTLFKADNNPVSLAVPLANTGSPIQIASNPDQIQAGNYVMISDCEAADLFVAATVATVGTDTVITHGGPSNRDPNLSKVYGANASVVRFTRDAYYLRDSGRTYADGTPIFSLFRRSVPVNGGPPPPLPLPVELVEGVTGMVVSYGLDTNAAPDKAIEMYATSAGLTGAQWSAVKTARLELLVAGEDNVARQAQPFFYNGVVNMPPLNMVTGQPDRRLRQSFATTAAFRNLLN